MGPRRRWGASIVFVALLGAGCGAPMSPATARPAAASSDEYVVAACAAWDALFRAVGNPDTGSGSDLSRSLDQAVKASDVASAERLAGAIVKELEAGRQHVAVARGWQPRAAVMVQLDRVFVGFEAMTAAKVSVARHDPNAVDPQAALEQAGGIDAWFAMFEAARSAGMTGAATEQRCPNVPVSP